MPCLTDAETKITNRGKTMVGAESVFVNDGMISLISFQIWASDQMAERLIGLM
jgi:hypothetical protein